MFSSKSLLVFAIVLVLIYFCSSYPVIKEGKVWRYIAFVDGKAFMAEVNETMTWHDAGNSCATNLMELASITSLNQASELESSFKKLGIESDFWTSGRDAGTLQQFVWNDTKSQPSETFLKTDISGAYRTCLALHTFSDISFPLLMHQVDCNIKLHVLCQDTGPQLEELQ